jgi:hypothetical protein
VKGEVLIVVVLLILLMQDQGTTRMPGDYPAVGAWPIPNPHASSTPAAAGKLGLDQTSPGINRVANDAGKFAGVVVPYVLNQIPVVKIFSKPAGQSAQWDTRQNVLSIDQSVRGVAQIFTGHPRAGAKKIETAVYKAAVSPLKSAYTIGKSAIVSAYHWL